MEIKKLNPVKIQVATAYQRGISQAAVNRIRRNFKPEAFGVLTVGIRDDGTYWCVDGQTRLQAALALEMDFVECRTFPSGGSADEASVFRYVNSQRGMSLVDKLRAQLEQGDPDTEEMVEIVKRNGFLISFDRKKTWPHICAVSALQAAYRANVLDSVLKVIMQSWGDIEDGSATNVALLGGLTRLLKRHGDIIPIDRLVACLKKKTCAHLIGLCDAGMMQGGKRNQAMYEVLVKMWNKGRSKNRIDMVLSEK